MSAPGVPILTGLLTVEGVAVATAVIIAAGANTNGILIVAAHIKDGTLGGAAIPGVAFVFGATQTMLKTWAGARQDLPAGQYLYLPAGQQVSIFVNAGATADFSLVYKVL
jgi:glyoxylate utilization-related uncharacterized protein